MGILKFVASADTTITNAFESGLSTRGTGSNMGYADSLEVFSIYGQTSGSTGQSQELSRMLIKFPITSISAARTAGTIPASGSVSFYLKMYNAQHPFTLPQGFSLTIAPLSRSWSEGTGLDMDEYKDLGSANWLKARLSASGDGGVWTSIGGDYRTGSNYSVSFPKGYENIDLNITGLIEKWISGADPAYANNYGVGIHLSSSQEGYFSSSTGQDTTVLINNPGGATTSYYTKKFFSRSTEFFFKKPAIEARWDSRIQDDREYFFYSSSFAPAADNLNNLYLYNYVRGRLVNLPSVGTGDVYVSLYDGTTVPKGSKITLWNGNVNITASWVKTGIYTAALAATSSEASSLFDVWHSGSLQYYTGSLYPEAFPTYSAAPTITKVTSCTNLKKSYLQNDTSRFRFFIRDRNWNPTIYVKANANNPTDIMPSASYSIRRVTDDYVAIPYGTGSNYSTYLSYDKDGNYFDLDMALLDAGYMYEIKISYYNDSVGDWEEQMQTFKFRVEE